MEDPNHTSYSKHPTAIIETDKIGSGTRIWAFTHVLADVKIGKDCNLCDHVFVENGVVIGDRVTIKCGVQLWTGITLEDDVFIGPNATFTNDHFPRSKVYPETFAKTLVKQGASIGANATILPGIEIGSRSMIGAGAVVLKDVPPNAIVVGNPAKIVGYVDTKQHPVLPVQQHSEPYDLKVKEAKLYRLPKAEDLRGVLSYGEFANHLPFIPQRYFLTYGVPSREVRGEHAHKTLKEFLICVHGSCSAILDDGDNRVEVILDSPTLGLFLPPMVWGIQYKYSPDAVLLVFASDIYKPDDYIRNYHEFLKLRELKK